MDHPRSEVDFDRRTGGDVVDGAVVDVIADVRFLRKQDDGFDSPPSSVDNGAGDIVIAEVGHFDIDVRSSGVESVKEGGFDFESLCSVVVMVIAEEIDRAGGIEGDFTGEAGLESLDVFLAFQGNHVIQVSGVAVFDINGTGEEYVIVE